MVCTSVAKIPERLRIAIVRNPPTSSAIKIRHDASLKDSLRSSASEYLSTFYLIDSELKRVMHCGAHNSYRYGSNRVNF